MGSGRRSACFFSGSPYPSSSRRSRLHSGRRCERSRTSATPSPLGSDGGTRVRPGWNARMTDDERPLILAVDEDPEALVRITHELQRYARDYKVICGPSTEAALSQLQRLHEQGDAVAIVLA